MDEAGTQEQRDELVTIAGGIEMEVAYRNNGSKETVKVRQIPISKIQLFVMAMGNEAELIELYCDRPAGWADTLTLESAGAIADKGQELNLPFFEAWFRRAMKWRKSQEQPGSTITGVPEKTTEAANPPSPSGNLPQQSPITTT